MKAFWNQRYSESTYAYGKAPNAFFKSALQTIQPGRVLLPAEGEGRNAVYAAGMGFEVVAFDISEMARAKALRLAEERNVELTYFVANLPELDLPSDSFDAVALIYAHFPPAQRRAFHLELVRVLRPGGQIILEAFSKAHLAFNRVNPSAGGPQEIELLYSEAELLNDFSELDIVLCETVEVDLNEGVYHVGRSSVVRLIATKG